ncbi:MAG: thioredoxin-disulfide reductase [Fimbriimonadaceae bacterium]
MTHDVLIIGSGPAGYTAAVYAARANLSPMMIAGPEPGGQLMITTDVENYPGFPDGILGPELMELFQKQAERFGTTLKHGMVDHVDFGQSPFRVSSGAEEFLARTVIISTGASAKWTGAKGETEFGGHGVSACATCDGFFFRGKKVAVIGGGDTAMEEAVYLTRHAEHVTVVHRRDTLRASKIMQQRALDHPKISFAWNRTLLEVLGDEGPPRKVTGMVLEDTTGGPNEVLPIDGVFVAIGHQPNSQVFTPFLESDELGYLKVHPGTTRTKIPGVFACGDVTDRVYRQAVTAAGTGCMAAIEAERYLEALDHA